MDRESDGRSVAVNQGFIQQKQHPKEAFGLQPGWHRPDA
jgi:hypothetical protein